MKLQRKKPCDVCGSKANKDNIIVDGGFKVKGDDIDVVYSETCKKCGNLLYGKVSPLK